HARYYEDFELAGYQFGPSFREVQNIWRLPGEAVTEIAVPAEIAATAQRYYIHPAVLDAAFHLFKGFKISTDPLPGENFYLPQSIRRVHLLVDKPPSHLWAHGKLLVDDGKALVADIFVYDDAGRRVADILGFRLDRVEQKRAADDIDNCYYRYHWEARRLRGQGTQGACAFPAGAELTAAARKNAADNYHQHELDKYYGEFAPRIDALVCQSVENALCKLGWQPQIGEHFTTLELIEQLGIVEPYPRLLQAHLRDLAKHGLLRATGDDAWEVRRAPKHSEIASGWQQLIEAYPRFSAEALLHQRLSPHLAELLSGEADAIELMFPGGSSEYLERFYVEGGDFPAQRQIVGAAISRLAETLPRRRVLRVLEIGGGTGSLTRIVLPHLPAERTEYLFTDITPAFLAAAKKQFAGFPFVQYRTFDVEKDPKSQGLEPESFDLIVGSLVLHATADLKQALANLRSCLAPNGMLMFLEVFPRRHAWDNIFGLLAGWWRFTDTSLRKYSPLLERGPWLELLADCGFHDAGTFGTSADERESEQAFLFAFAPPVAAKCLENEADAKPKAGWFVVLADRLGVADALIARLSERGHSVIAARAGDGFERFGENEFVIDPQSEDDLRRVVHYADGVAPELAGVVHCWSLDHPLADGLSPERLQQAQQTGVLSALHLLRVLSNGMPPRIWFVTRGVYQVQDGDRSAGLASSPIVGLARVANNEYFPSRFAVVDLDTTPEATTIDDVLLEFVEGDDELEVAYRSERRHVLRLGRVRAEELPARSFEAVRPHGEIIPYRLQTGKPGILTNLSLNETVRREPGPNEIEIRVRAGGINFRDVMKALGTYPGNPIDLLWFGDDVAGTVERVGSGVRDLRPGDEVVGMVPYCFRTYVTADSRMVFRKPKRVSFEEAATLPTVFLTAHYAINHLAQMQAGESILIHAGTGGVGQAAIQIAKHLGLEIIATAGSPEKRQLLKDQGVNYVLNSRTLEFADQIMEITKGHGVDAVLNSLAGDFIPKSMSVLAPFG
ncbi:MAG TPA: polyketide synthase dehydratase domain-containing protein, partial [Gemmataceae bacterium]|nr:polyketide synthase dehydratase domain-containing protein [Gemmataceae bacterium]